MHVSLCPGSTFRLTGPIVFTAKDQEVSTEGYPTDDTRAKLLTVGKTITAVQCVAFLAPYTVRRTEWQMLTTSYTSGRLLHLTGVTVDDVLASHSATCTLTVNVQSSVGQHQTTREGHSSCWVTTRVRWSSTAC